MLMLDFLMADADKKKELLVKMVAAFITLNEMINIRISSHIIWKWKDEIRGLCLKFEDEIIEFQLLYGKSSIEYTQLEKMQGFLSNIINPIDLSIDEGTVPYNSIPTNLSEIKAIIRTLSPTLGFTLPRNFGSSFTETLDKIVSRLEIITQNSLK
jgi:hypothetical protein